MTAQGLGSLLPMWETHIEFLAPAVCLAQALAITGACGGNPWTEGHLSVTLSFK